jgi:hypothetical protein
LLSKPLRILFAWFCLYLPLAAVFSVPIVTMKFLTPSLTFFAISAVLGSLAVSPVLASLATSPRTNALLRRTGECYVVTLQFPNPITDHPCGTGYVIGNCNCCPSGQIGCLSPAVCTLGSTDNYVCAIPSGSGSAQCAPGEVPCGARCMPAGADCCGTGATYCPAPKLCGANPDGSNACFTSGQSAATSSAPAAQASTSVGGQAATTPSASATKVGTSVGVQTSIPSSSITPSSPTDASASQTMVSLGNACSVGGALIMLAIILSLY